MSQKVGPMSGSFDKPVSVLDTSLAPRLPDVCATLFAAKKAKKISFEQIAQALGREEVACAAIFYGQAKASEEDCEKLAELLGINVEQLKIDLYAWPHRGSATEMPPREPLIYRLYEIVQNYGAPMKAVLNEKFGDGIMSAISFSMNIKKETDEKGDWAVITMRGKWLPFTRF